MSDELAARLIEEEEGRVAHAYPDHLGFLTIGVGHLIDAKKGGRLSDPIIDAIFAEDRVKFEKQAALIPGYFQLNAVQRAVIVSMLFQLGGEGFDGDGVKDWTNMLAAIARGDVKEAARHGRDSKWWREDTPGRAERQMRMLETGLWVPRNFEGRK